MNLLMQALGEEFEKRAKQHKSRMKRQYPAWLCPSCGNPAIIDTIFPFTDGRLWKCDLCRVVAITPSGLRQLPCWVSSQLQ
jgi:hypothetical protein